MDFMQIRVQDEGDSDDDDVMVLTKYTVGHHDHDTDDIAIEFGPDMEDKHHSKQWNMMVN